MINPLDIQSNIVALLQAIPELVDAVGDVDSIQGHDDESVFAGDADTAAMNMMGRAILVAWTGAELPREGETRGWTHNFRIAVKAQSITDYFSIAKMIFDGIPQEPAGDGCNTFLNSTIHDECDGVQNADLSPQSKSGVYFIDFSITERA